CRKVVLQKGKIKIHIMRHEHLILQHRIYPACNIFKAGSILHHLIADTGECLNIQGNRKSGIDQGSKPLRHPGPVMYQYGNLSNAVSACMAARGFYIYNGIHYQYSEEMLI